MRTFVQVYLLTILAMKRIQNFLNFRICCSDSGIREDILSTFGGFVCESIVNLEFCSSLIMHHGQKWKLEIEN